MQNNIEVKRNIPRDLFLHLLAIVTLYWSSISFIGVVWQFINRFFPDILNDPYYGDRASLIRFHLSALIIVFPVFIIASWYLNKIYKREAEVRESKIRKWLLYLTLFISSLVIIGDLIFIINAGLGGEITVRFILKALSIIFVAGIILSYYLDDVRRDTPTKLAKPFAWATSILIAIAIVGAFFIVGSPTTARLYQFDQQRVQALTTIQYEIVNYWQSKEKLPISLADLSDNISGFRAPSDPETNLPYIYKITNEQNLSFELCATFKLASQISKSAVPVVKDPTSDSYNQNWNHPAGEYCFSRTIDRQKYPPFSTLKK